MPRYRIGLLHYSCSPVVGGVEEVLRQHAMVLSKMGQEVSVLAGMGEVYRGDFAVRIEPILGSQNPRVKDAHDLAIRGVLRPLEGLTDEVYGLLQEWSRDLDVVIAHNVLHMPFNLPLTLALWRLAHQEVGPKVVSWAHDSPFFHRGFPDYLTRPPWDVLKRRHPRIRYVTISRSRKELFEEHLGDFDWQLIHNGINPFEFFYLDPRSLRLARELELLERDLVIVQPSRIIPRKNLELSIRIVHGIKNLGYNVLLVVTGAHDPHQGKAESYYQGLKSLIEELALQDNVAILAEYTLRDGKRLFPDRVIVRDLYLMADLLLMTSKDEGFGLPLIEAGMIKLPIACTDIPPFLEIGVDVCFFRLDEPPLFIAGRIMEYLSRCNTHAMFRKVMKDYVWDVICQREILPFLEDVIKRGPNT